MYLREDTIRDAVNAWLGKLFHQDNIDQTVTALVNSQNDTAHTANSQTLKKRVTDAEARLQRFQEALEAGVDPSALVEAINSAQNERAAAHAQLNNTRPPNTLTDAELHAMIDSLGNVGAALNNGKPDSLANLYTALDLQVRYENEVNSAEITVQPASRVNSKRVRGGT